MIESHYVDADLSGIFLGDIYYAVVPFGLREPIWVITPQFSQRRATRISVIIAADLQTTLIIGAV